MHGPPFHPPYWPGSPPPSPHNGASFELAMVLGRLEAESRRHTEILLALPGAIADQMAARVPPSQSTPGATTPATSAAAPLAPPPAPASPPTTRLGTLREWIVALAALGALIGALIGKLTWGDALGILQRIAGIGS